MPEVIDNSVCVTGIGHHGSCSWKGPHMCNGAQTRNKRGIV